MKKSIEQALVPADMKYLQDTLYVVSSKWKLLILHSLASGISKFREIQRSVPGITPRMLSRELTILEINGFLTRKVNPDSMTYADYEVTHYCKSFEKIIQEMIHSGNDQLGKEAQVIYTAAISHLS